MSRDDRTQLGLGGDIPVPALSDGAGATLPIAPGVVIAGKYRVVRLLSSGEMGAVIVAEHEALGQRVAIKMLLPELIENSEAAERFMREARATARIRSDYVARVLDVDQLEEGAPYIVMELLQGEPLDVVIANEGAMVVADAVDLMMQALTGLAHAHDAGVVHRDLKPCNLFVTRMPDGDRRIKLLDFGISKLLVFDGLADPGVLTGQAQILGSPRYMSPEQVRDAHTVDSRGDLWSIGVILFEMLAGRPAIDAETVGGAIAMIMRETPPRLDAIRDDIAAELADIVAMALRRDRDERFASAEEMRRALCPHGSRSVSESLRISSPPPPPPRSDDLEMMAIEEPLPPIPGVRAGRGWWVVAASMTVIIGVAVLYTFIYDSPVGAKRVGSPVLTTTPVLVASQREASAPAPHGNVPTSAPNVPPTPSARRTPPNVLEHRRGQLPPPVDTQPSTDTQPSSVDPLEFRD